MAALSNIRQERFARSWMRTGIAAEAYLKAGYRTKPGHSTISAASRLLMHVDVHRRIMELRKQMAARGRVTVDTLVEELDAARGRAQTLDQPSVEVSAVMAKARLTGFLVDRKEIGEPGAFTNASQADIMARVQAELGDDAVAALGAALAAADRMPEPEPAEPEPAQPTTRTTPRAPGETLN